MLKLGIHSSDWDKLLAELREQLPELFYNIVVEILITHSTNYF